MRKQLLQRLTQYSSCYQLVVGRHTNSSEAPFHYILLSFPTFALKMAGSIRKMISVLLSTVWILALFATGQQFTSPTTVTGL